MTITTLSTLLPLPFINWLPAAGEETSEPAKTALQESEKPEIVPNLMSELVIKQPAEEVID